MTKAYRSIWGLITLAGWLVLASTSVAQAVQPQGIFLATSIGHQDSFSMSATLPAYCAGQHTYVVAIVPNVGNFAFIAQNVPVLWLTGEIPSYTGIVGVDGSISILSGVDMRPPRRICGYSAGLKMHLLPVPFSSEFRL